MARIVCFSDQDLLTQLAQQGAAPGRHTFCTLPASLLNDGTRRAVLEFEPEIALLELAHTLDNPHLFFFLKSDKATRDIPIILVSSSKQVEQHAAVLGATAALRLPCSAAQIDRLVESCLDARRQSLMAAEALAAPARTPYANGQRLLRRLSISA